jgi:hypothetical protein
VSDASPWRAFYESGFQGFWALLAAPALWLAWRALRGRPAASGVHPPARGFVDAFAVVFAVQTLLDPIATGPLAGALGGGAATVLGLSFVLLGDFRVFLLVAYLAGGRCALGPALREAALLTPVVPLAALAVQKLLPAVVGPLPGQALWLIHETLFLGMVAFLRRRIVAARGGSKAPRRAATPNESPRQAATPNAPPTRAGAQSEPAPPALQAYLRAVTAYVAAYYGLWALSDVLILAGVEWAWGLRAVPNQLYYAFFVPFVWARFFARS